MSYMQQAETNFLRELVDSAKSRVDRGYYQVPEAAWTPRASLVESLRVKDRIPIIAEVKFRSPAEGRLTRRRDVEDIARTYECGGAVGISVLTEPDHFEGRLDYVSVVKRTVRVPVLMKDVVVDRAQVEAGRRVGADAVLLIAGVFGGGIEYPSLAEMVKDIHRKGMEAVVEVHDAGEYKTALAWEADIVGINNRDLRTLRVSLDISRRLLGRRLRVKPVICESGIRTKEEVDELRGLGADGFLLGSVLMKSGDSEATLRRLSSR